MNFLNDKIVKLTVFPKDFTLTQYYNHKIFMITYKVLLLCKKYIYQVNSPKNQYLVN